MIEDETEPGGHLSPSERQQLLLHPTCEATYDYLEQHPETAQRAQGVGIDRDVMAVTVFWAGGPFDPRTEEAFDDITDRTGFPIVAVPVVLTREEVRTAHDRIFAEQKGVRTAGADMLTDPDTIEVGVVGSLVGRPDSIEVNGKAVPLRYHLSDMQPVPAPGTDE